MIDLEHKLNPQQRMTAGEINGAFLIIAGAGSGKTRTIIYRIANMLEKGIPQSFILALTFTNKAAKEMQERITELTGKKLPNLTISTFHAFGVQILRKTVSVLGYKENFSIYDQDDKMRLIKETARAIKKDPNDLNLYETANLFSGIKTGRTEWTPENEEYRELYNEYLEHLKVYNAMDFDDLIILPIKIFRENPEILQKYRNRFKYIMVDEFQDTSKIQYDLIHLLAEEFRNICVVGDDDQSIYSWRGASYENILRFEKDFPEAKEIKLEQNYRSSETILDAANGIIAHNKHRKTKNLWSKSGKGKPIEIQYPENEIKEAEFIANMIILLKGKEGIKYDDFGILIRTNSLSAAIEDAFLIEGIPYTVSGGSSFFQQKEIKDITAYLRVMTNPEDDISLLRVINTPRRGIGKKTLEIITDIGKKKKCSVYTAINAAINAENSPLPDKAKAQLEEFLQLISFYRKKIISGKNLAETLTNFVDQINYWEYLIMDFQKNEKIAKYKYKNINTFIHLMERWESDPDNSDADIYTYLNRISLITRDDDQDKKGGKVNLMTIHGAKGLEFKIVFLAGCEDTIIPHARALEENPDNIEEERRLFYVAVTRAMEKLYITSCKSRHYNRETVICMPSRFLEEIPASLYNSEAEISEEEKMKKITAKFDKFKSLWGQSSK